MIKNHQIKKTKEIYMKKTITILRNNITENRVYDESYPIYEGKEKLGWISIDEAEQAEREGIIFLDEKEERYNIV